jgi:hypothetical protein
MPRKNETLELLMSLKKDFESLTAEVQALKSNKEPEKGEPEKTEKPVEKINEFPVPQEYREIVDQTLNRHFGVDLKMTPGDMSFMLTIIVPKKYSNMTEGEWAMKGADLRSRVITYAEGTNGVKMWADKVFDNFASEMKAQIIADRI